MIDLTAFIAEATTLARPSTQYRTDGAGQPYAYWHGNLYGGLVISVRYERQWLDVFTVRRGKAYIEVRDVPRTSDTPLFAHSALSLPPIDVVLMRGSPAIEHYLTQNGWRRDWSYSNNFKDPIAHAYNEHWQTTCPMYTTGVHAVSGGWPFPWPDNDYDQWIDSDLVLWTLSETEPWVEVFSRDGQFHVIERIT